MYHNLVLVYYCIVHRQSVVFLAKYERRRAFLSLEAKLCVHASPGFGRYEAPNGHARLSCDLIADYMPEGMRSQDGSEGGSQRWMRASASVIDCGTYCCDGCVIALELRGLVGSDGRDARSVQRRQGGLSLLLPLNWQTSTRSSSSSCSKTGEA